MQRRSFQGTYGKDKKGSIEADAEKAGLNQNNRVSIKNKKHSVYNVKLRDLEQSKKYTIRVNTVINGRTIASRSQCIEAVFSDS